MILEESKENQVEMRRSSGMTRRVGMDLELSEPLGISESVRKIERREKVLRTENQKMILGFLVPIENGQPVPLSAPSALYECRAEREERRTFTCYSST